MKYFAAPVEKLIEQFRSLKGVGKKTATRLAFSILIFQTNKCSILPMRFWTPSGRLYPVGSALISAIPICAECARMKKETQALFAL